MTTTKEDVVINFHGAELLVEGSFTSFEDDEPYFECDRILAGGVDLTEMFEHLDKIKLIELLACVKFVENKKDIYESEKEGDY